MIKNFHRVGREKSNNNWLPSAGWINWADCSIFFTIIMVLVELVLPAFLFFHPIKYYNNSFSTSPSTPLSSPSSSPYPVGCGIALTPSSRSSKIIIFLSYLSYSIIIIIIIIIILYPHPPFYSLSIFFSFYFSF